MAISPGSLFLESAIKHFRYYKNLGDKTFAQLADEDFHFEPEGELNSIAIIIQHMSGNMISRWTNFLTEDGEKSWRSRDEEFGKRQLTKSQLLAAWDKGWQLLLTTLEALTDDDLLKTVLIRHEPHIVIDAVNRQLSHYPYHVGQIVYIGKMIKGAGWVSLSIAKGKSEQFNKMMKEEMTTPPGKQ